MEEVMIYSLSNTETKLEKLTNHGMLESMTLDLYAFKAKYAEAVRNKLLTASDVWRRWLV